MDMFTRKKSGTGTETVKVTTRCTNNAVGVTSASSIGGRFTVDDFVVPMVTDPGVTQ